MTNDIKYDLGKYDLICEGIKLIKNYDLVSDWKEMVKSANDTYTRTLVIATCLALEKLEGRTPFTFEEIENLLHELNLTLYMKGIVIERLAYFSEKGELLKKYWERKMHMDTEELLSPTLVLKSSLK